MRQFALIAAILTLTGCGTPQEQCVKSVTRDLRTLDSLIAQSETALVRGYTYEERTVTRWAWVRCHDGRYRAGVPRSRCWEPYDDVVRDPVAIDPAAEARKLDGLKSRRAALVRPTETAIQDCRERYPE